MLAQPKRTHLNRALSKLGYCSRGVAETWIAAGRVLVNGVVASDPEFWVEIGTDLIQVLETKAPAPDRHLYLCMHKPAGYVTTRSDELDRKTVYDLLPPEFAAKGRPEAAWIFPVGRLDLESEGLLLLTNDGEWANLLTDPEFHVEKIYRIKLDGRPLPGQLETFRTGIELDGRMTLPARADAESDGWIRVAIMEGRNRQIRRMFHALGYKVKRLVRISIGPLELGDLKPGESRPLEESEVEMLRQTARGKSV